MFSCYIIGDDLITVKCAEILLSNNWSIKGILSQHPQVKQWTINQQIRHFNTLKDCIDAAKQQPFDYLFSIANPRILSSECLQLPKQLAINYHNAPLPLYGGVYATSWAILNGEKTHGITWHVMSVAIDEGDILKQALVDIDPDETAQTLNIKCSQQGITSFSELLNELMANQLRRVKQNVHNGSYYSFKNRLPNDGLISWSDSAITIERLCRALTFGDSLYFQNRLGLPKLIINNKLFIVQKFKLTANSSQAKPGTIVRISEEALFIATADQDVALYQVINMQGEVLTASMLVKHASLKENAQLTIYSDDLLSQLTHTAIRLQPYEKFWIQQLENIAYPEAITATNAQTLLPKTKSTDIRIASIDIKEQHITGIQNSSREQPINFNMILLTAYLIVLYRLGNFRPFTINFSDIDLYNLAFGKEFIFANEIPLTIHFDPKHTFFEALETILTKINEVSKNLTYLSDLPLRYNQLAQNTVDIPLSVHIRSTFNDNSLIESAPLIFALTENGHEAKFVQKNHQLQSTVDQFKQSIELLIEQVAVNPALPLAKISLISAQHYQQLIYDWNQTHVDYTAVGNLHQLFEEQAKKNPMNIAVIDSIHKQQLTYQQLNQKANQLARYLIKQGLTRETRIAFCFERSAEMVICMLALLKAGGTYVPLDPNYPASRLEYILQDTQTSLLLTSNQQADKFNFFIRRHLKWDDLATFFIMEADTNFQCLSNASDLLCIIYTSGSTGNPKGVMITRDNMYHAMQARLTYYPETLSGLLLLLSIGFDTGNAAALFPLLKGGKLVLLKESHSIDLTDVRNLINTHQVSHILCTPTFYSGLLKDLPISLLSLKQVIIGGEKCSNELIENHIQQLPDTSLTIEYGPTEATVWCTATTVYDARKNLHQPNSIGRPIANNQIYLLDNYLNPVPIGIMGEVYIGGKGITQGYLNQVELTQKVFLPNPFSSDLSPYLYKTGDLARYDKEGYIYFINRVAEDSLVKFRGFRIDLKEIEQVLLQYPLIKAAVVQLVQDNQTNHQFLAAYIILKQNLENNASYTTNCINPVTTETIIIAIKDFLSQYLPYYMLPSAFEILTEFPLTTNGKLDKKRLPAIQLTNKAITLPQTEVQQQLAIIFKEILNISSVSIEDNFFTIGGNSLSINQLKEKIKQSFNIEISLVEIFNRQTIKQLANYIELQDKEIVIPDWQRALFPIRSTGSEVPLFIIHPVSGLSTSYQALSRYLSDNQPMYGVNNPYFGQPNAPYESLEEQASLYIKTIEQVQAKGPYRLAGFSYGGLVALEIAHQLAQRQQKVEIVFVIDSFLPNQLYQLSERVNLNSLFAANQENNEVLLREIEHNLDLAHNYLLKTYYAPITWINASNQVFLKQSRIERNNEVINRICPNSEIKLIQGEHFDLFSNQDALQNIADIMHGKIVQLQNESAFKKTKSNEISFATSVHRLQFTKSFTLDNGSELNQTTQLPVLKP